MLYPSDYDPPTTDIFYDSTGIEPKISSSP